MLSVSVMKNCDPARSSRSSSLMPPPLWPTDVHANETVPLLRCLRVGCFSGVKYGLALFDDDEAGKRDQMLSPPLPVFVGSPVWARKSRWTLKNALNL